MAQSIFEMKTVKKKFLTNQKTKKAANNKNFGPYSVIKLKEKETGNTLFDCIPDVWFSDENQDRCWWPPPKGKNVAIRALKQEIPDDTWEIYNCEVVKRGFGN